jgi:hypothetical protein
VARARAAAEEIRVVRGETAAIPEPAIGLACPKVAAVVMRQVELARAA